MNEDAVNQSALTLANAAELISCIVKEIAGNDISNSLNGSKATSELICSIVLSRMEQRLLTH
jgi:hypothetical protein